MRNSKSCPEGIPSERKGAIAAKLTRAKVNAAKGNLAELGLVCWEGMSSHEHTSSLRDGYNRANSVKNSAVKINTPETYSQKLFGKVFSSRGGTKPVRALGART